jgi:putative FmdB family regulatory protein
MAIYEYKCDDCGHGFERQQKMSEPPVSVCPQCGKREVRRLFSSFVGLVKAATPSCGDRGAPCRGSDAVCAAGKCPIKG